MLRTKFFVLSATLSVAGLLALGGCSASSSSTAWQDATPTQKPKYEHLWKHQYVYYPRTKVYYDPYNKTWYWKDDSSWQHSAQLPSKFTVFGDRPMIVRMPTDLWQETHYAGTQTWGGQDSYTPTQTMTYAKARAKTEIAKRQTQTPSHGRCLPRNSALSQTQVNTPNRYAVRNITTQNVTRVASTVIHQRRQTAYVEAQSDAPEK